MKVCGPFFGLLDAGRDLGPCDVTDVLMGELAQGVQCTPLLRLVQSRCGGTHPTELDRALIASTREGPDISNGPLTREWRRPLEFVVRLPTFARRGAEHPVGHIVVGDATGLRVKLECSAETLGQHTKHEHLRQFPGHMER